MTPDANPLEDIGNVRRIRAAVKKTAGFFVSVGATRRANISERQGRTPKLE
jgi:hypothetical protein